MNKTKTQIIEAVKQVANYYGATAWWSTEDGITTITLGGGQISPKIFDEVTRSLSQATGRDCYFDQCWLDSIEVSIDAQMEFADDVIPPPYPDGYMVNPNRLFK